ncbi:MAG: hypothetical protein ACREX3_02745, partial [Gammaproteobacteria bacterium]
MHRAVIAGFVIVTVAAVCAAGIGPSFAGNDEVVCGNAELVAPGTISTKLSEVRLTVSPDGSRMLWGTIGWDGGA